MLSSGNEDHGSSPSGTAPELGRELVVVMPAYNEAACIAQVCRDWLAALSGIQDAILLVVDDGSRDDTGKILDDLSQSCSSLKVVHQENAGHGAALLRGYLAALQQRPSWILHADSDNQFAAEDLRKLWESRQSCRFILGFRAERQDSVHRILLSRALSVLNLLLFGCYVRDANTPFRLIRSDVLVELLRMVPRQCLIPNIFLSVLAKSVDAGFCEMPVTQLARAAGHSSLISWRLVSFSLRAFFQLLELRLRLWKQAGLVRDLRERVKQA